MASIQGSIRAHLAADAALTALVGDRIFPDYVPPHTTPTPWVMYTTPELAPEAARLDHAGDAAAEVVFDVLGDDYAAVVQIADLVRSRLHTFRGGQVKRALWRGTTHQTVAEGYLAEVRFGVWGSLVTIVGNTGGTARIVTASGSIRLLPDGNSIGLEVTPTTLTFAGKLIGDGSGLTGLPTGLPNQTGNAGKYLTTDGTSPSWVAVGAPDLSAYARFDTAQTFTKIQTFGAGLSSPGVGTGANCVVLGTDAGKALTTGERNTLVGVGAGSALTTGSHNTLIGRNAGQACQAGSAELVVIGMDAGYTGGTTAAQDVLIGSNATINGGAYGRVVIGRGAAGNGTNAVAIGQGASSTGGIVIGSNNTVTSGTSHAFGTVLTVSHSECLFFGSEATSTQNGEMRFAVRNLQATRFALNALCYNGAGSVGVDRRQVVIDGVWADNSDAARKSRLTIKAVDASGEREGLRVESDGAAPKVSTHGVTAVGRQTLPAAATDLASAITLGNAIRTALIAFGPCQ